MKQLPHQLFHHKHQTYHTNIRNQECHFAQTANLGAFHGIQSHRFAWPRSKIWYPLFKGNPCLGDGDCIREKSPILPRAVSPRESSVVTREVIMTETIIAY